MTNNNLLTTNDVAVRLNVSLNKASALMLHGNIPTVRIGRNVRVRPEDLDKYILVNLKNSLDNTPQK